MGFKNKLKIDKKTKDILNNDSDIKTNIMKFFRKTKSFVIDVKTNTVDFLSWLFDKCKTILKSTKKEKVKKEKVKESKDEINIKQEKIKKVKKKKKRVFNKKRNTILLVTSFVLLIIAVLSFLSSIFNNRKPAFVKESVDDDIKFISIKDGYITERLIVESGELLPNISEYFSEGYELSDDVTITYLINDTAIPVESFTYQQDNLLYVRGSNSNISVSIKNFGEVYTSSLVIRDSTAPTIQLEPISIVSGTTVNPMSFVAIFIDNSHSFEFTAELVSSGDYTKVGTHEVEVKVCDASGNCSQGKTSLTVTKKETSDEGSGNSGGGNSGGSGGSGNSGNSGGSGGGSGGSSKPNIDDNNSSNDNSSGSSSGNNNDNSGNSGTSGAGGSSLDAAVARTVVGTFEENNYYLTVNYYGATKTTFYGYVKFIKYSDGYVEILDSNNDGTPKWNYTTFNADANLSLMKRDAISFLLEDSTAQDKMKNTFLTRTNELRTSVGVSKVTYDYDLSVIAMMRIYEMVYGDSLSHTRPNGENFDTMITDYGYKAGKYTNGKQYFGENLAAGLPTNVQAFEALKGSDGHYKNMVNEKYKKMGVATFYDKDRKMRIWVQVFTS